MQLKPVSQQSFKQLLRSLIGPPDFSRKTITEYLFIISGALVQALAMRMFLIPAQLVSGGISGTSQIINHFTGWPIGLMVLIGNLPLFVLGWQYLGGARFAKRTALAIALFALFTDLLVLFIPAQGVTDDLLLDCLYGGVMLGIGLGMVYRGQGTSGGSDILGRILNHRLGISISQAYLITDTLVVLAGGFAFSWEKALYALLVIYISGLAAEAVSEGSGIFRTALIITAFPEQVARNIMTVMERGVTILPGTGAYTGSERPVLYCVITRAEVNPLKQIVSEADPRAFMVIGQAHDALGEGFRPLIK
jgi:uncharacterized membrane-anchored protein YitT (DUF2179 family)